LKYFAWTHKSTVIKVAVSSCNIYTMSQKKEENIFVLMYLRKIAYHCSKRE